MFNKPKSFSQILDHTFSLSKNRFKEFFMILLVLMGPIYLLQAVIELFSGVSFFREIGSTGGTWYEKFLSGVITAETAVPSLGATIGLFFIGLLSFLLFPVAEAAILFALNHIRKNEEFTVRSVIKQAFSRFWPIIGSSILYGLIMFGLMIIPLVFISITGIMGSMIHPAIGIILSIVFLTAFAVGIGYLLTRWSFYFASVVLERESPGFSNSWGLTKNRAWILMGLYILFFLIISCISLAIEMTFGIFLGYSVLLSIIVNIATLFTTMILSVGYGVMYLDLKIRHDADDLKEMIDDYHAY